MREGIVLGSVTSTIKHPSMNGKKLLIVQVLDAKGEPEGKPQVAVDYTGAGKSDRVILSWDGIFMREVNAGQLVPQRASLSGIIDEVYRHQDKPGG